MNKATREKTNGIIRGLAAEIGGLGSRLPYDWTQHRDSQITIPASLFAKQVRTLKELNQQLRDLVLLFTPDREE